LQFFVCSIEAGLRRLIWKNHVIIFFCNGIKYETLEKYSILFKSKAGDNFNRPRGMGSAFHRAGRHTLKYFED
jgi:hypothetical protein